MSPGAGGRIDGPISTAVRRHFTSKFRNTHTSPDPYSRPTTISSSVSARSFRVVRVAPSRSLQRRGGTTLTWSTLRNTRGPCSVAGDRNPYVHRTLGFRWPRILPARTLGHNSARRAVLYQRNADSIAVRSSFPVFVFDARLHHVFTALSNPLGAYLAITSDDSSTVYYKISPGLGKPPI